MALNYKAAEPKEAGFIYYRKAFFGELFMVMIATVLSVGDGFLLVRNLSNNQEVRVNTRDAQRFARGDQIAIFYNGAMTASIPPQISAISIQKIPSGILPNIPTPPAPPTTPTTPAYTEMNAIVVQKRDNALLVNNLDTNTLYLVNSSYSRFFCVGQRIIVRYDRIRMTNPPEVDAVDILPVCS